MNEIPDSHVYGDSYSIMTIIIGCGLGYQSSNTELDWLHFT